MTQDTDKIDRLDECNAPPSLTIDWDLYLSYLENSDMDDEQKHDFIQTLWNIVVSFVDLGFEIDYSKNACEQDQVNPQNYPDSMLSSFNQNPENHNNITGKDASHHSAEKEDS